MASQWWYEHHNFTGVEMQSDDPPASDAARVQQSLVNIRALEQRGFCRHHSRAYGALVKECEEAAAGEASEELAERMEHLATRLRDHSEACDNLVTHVVRHIESCAPSD